jgi:hypothetical protein
LVESASRYAALWRISHGGIPLTQTTYAAPLKHTYLDQRIVDLHHNRIVSNLLQLFGVEEGDHVIEVGAGSGRWTRLLIERGLRVTAFEPDPSLAAKLDASIQDSSRLTIVQKPVQELYLRHDVKLLCGFHVLHHLDDVCLAALYERIRILCLSPSFAGWFFLEPNAANVLYPLAILVTPAMTFREEKGMWLNNYDKSLAGAGGSVSLGKVGFFPPRQLVNMLPVGLQMKGTTLRPGFSLFRAYSVYGALAKPAKIQEGAIL